MDRVAKNVLDLFDSLCRKYPDVVVLSYEGSFFTYGALKRYSDQFAVHLIKQGIKRTIVGLFFSRSIELVVSVLGVLKTGSAYIFLDPSYPEKRLKYIIEDSGIRFVLSKADSMRNVESLSVKAICYDDFLVSTQKQSVPNVEIYEQDLMYIIYTSGSTGKPKGVMVSHGNFFNRITWMDEQYDLLPSDRLIQKTAFSFDLAAWEVFWPLISMAQLCLLPSKLDKDPCKINDFMKKQRITVANFVPSQLESFLDANGIGELINLRLIFSGGEGLPWHLYKRVLKEAGLNIQNGYGPTEVTLDALFFVDNKILNSHYVPLGKPIKGMQVKLLDGKLNEVKNEVRGKIYIGGVGVSQGYLNRPGLTAKKFVPSLFSPGERMYDTGDIGCVLSDGNVDFFGRGDNQVKIRGFRVEIEEIENVICQYDGVRKAIVIVKRDQQGDAYLVAFVVPKNTELFYEASVVESSIGGKFSILKENGNFEGELRDFLQDNFPDYMNPSIFVFLDDMPYTSSGKTDRVFLSELHLDFSRAETYTPPRNDLEAFLCKTFEEYLQLPSVGIHDNFLRIGGHSLIAVRIASRIKDAYGIDIPMGFLFEYPSVQLLADELGSLIAHSDSRSIEEKQEHKYVAPLSFNQQRIWIGYKIAPMLYNIACAIKLKGKLNKEKLEKAFDFVVRRHKSFQTRFGERDNSPVQFVDPTIKGKLTEIEVALQEKILDTIHYNSNIAFDLEHDIPFKGYLFKISKQENIVQFVFHHIIADGWSMSIFFDELVEYYNSENPEKISLPPLSLDYVDVATNQRENLKESVIFKEGIEYWKKYLSPYSENTRLPYDSTRPKNMSYDGDTYSFSIPKNGILLDISIKNHTSIFSVIFSCICCLLYKYSNQKDIFVGTLFSGRNRKEFENIFGFFVNTVPIHSHFEPYYKFQDILKQIKESFSYADKYQDVPFESIISALNVNREARINPIFQVIIISDNKWLTKRFSGLEVEEIPIDRTAAEFDLSFYILVNERDVRISVKYPTELFKKSTIESIERHLRCFIKQLESCPNKCIGNLTILPTGEQHTILNPQKLLHVLPEYEDFIQSFLKQVRKQPDSTALSYHGRNLSYRELNERSNQLARYLRRIGIGLSEPVGIFLDRSNELIVSILAIFKVGAIYLPLSREYPRERLVHILQNTKTKFIISKEEYFINEIPNVTFVDVEGKKIFQESRLDYFVTLDQLLPAYIIYTSGSTGKPKGVMLHHSGLMNHIKEKIRILKLNSQTNIAQTAKVSFDISIWQLLTPLLIGGKVTILDDLEILDLKRFFDLIVRHKITVLEMVPTFFAEFNSFDWSSLNHLRFIILTGETINLSLCKKWMVDMRNQIPIVNAYGPTECSDDICHYIMHSADNINVDKSVIGEEIRGASVYILDSDLNLVSSGRVGEICVSGVCVGMGYWGTGALTAKAFAANPFEKGKRLYRTGDFGRCQENGNIEFLGRRDKQVKIKGFRVELEEIEAIINSCGEVKQSVLLVESSGKARLVACIVPSYNYLGDIGVSEFEETIIIDGDGVENLRLKLRDYLISRVPFYMVPEFFMFFKELPKTANGKIDRKLLAEYCSGHKKPNSHSEEYKNEKENLLSSVVQNLLGIESVKNEDNFFLIGMDSILAIRFVSVLNGMGIDLSIREIFEYQTIKDLAMFIKTNEENLRTSGKNEEFNGKI